MPLACNRSRGAPASTPRTVALERHPPRAPAPPLPGICDDVRVKRLVFLDVDGTLLNHDQQLPESARRALARALELGHELVMCTGRGKAEIYPFLWDIGFRGLVGYNGAYGELDGTIVFNDQMPQQDVAEIAAWMDSVKADCLWQTRSDLYLVRDFLDLFRPSSQSNQSIAGDWSAFLEQIAPYLREGVPETAAKLTFHLAAQCGATLADAQARFGDRFSVVAGSLAHDRGVTGELTALGMNKSVGLVKVADRLDVRLEDTIALGDSANDVEMLTRAGIGVAMGNGTREAKAAADWVTTSIDDDGLAVAFERLGLLEPTEAST